MSVVVDERIAERRKAVRGERRTRRLQRTIAVAVVLVLLAVAYALERSPLVELAEVRVTGIERLTAEAVTEAAALPLGTSTLRLGLGDAEARIEALPLVADAEARRVDPLTVEIVVVERRPAVVVTGRGGPVLLDAEGRIIDTGTVEGLPTIAVATGEALPPPGEEAAGLPALANAVRAYLAIGGPLRAEVATYVARGPEDLELVLDRGTTVLVGRADRMDEKARALAAVLEDVGATEVALIDVRAPATPVVRGSP